MSEIKTDLRRARLNRGHTQKQAAELIGCRRERYCRIENGHVAPSVRLRAALFHLYGVSPFTLERIGKGNDEA